MSWRRTWGRDRCCVQRPRFQDIPDSPGCYQFLDGDGRYLYVGKAISLRRRLPAYFRRPEPRIADMVARAEQLTWVVCGNETEALVLEASLVSRHRPPYNIKLQERHPYPYLALRDDGRRPVRLQRWRDRARPHVQVFGPYPNRDVIDALERLGQELFGLRSCNDRTFDLAAASGRPCLLADIGRCSAPCIGRTDIATHATHVNEFTSVLHGKLDVAQQQVRLRMREASDAQRYERAATLRDLDGALTRARERQRVTVPDGAAYDVLGVHVDAVGAACQLLWVRHGTVVGGRTLILDGTAQPVDVTAAAVTLLYQGTAALEPPRQLLVSALPDQVDLTSHYGETVPLRRPVRGWAKDLLDLAETNAAEVLRSERNRRDADPARRAAALDALGVALGIAAPWRIECFDIAHTQGVEVVAGMSVLCDALPAPAHYRHFRIRTVEGQDDYKSMAEAVGRRFATASTGQGPLPDLLLIDGGPGQLHAACEVLAALGVDVPVAALAKRLEELWLPGRAEPVVLADDDPALYVVQRARDEAHRTAGRLHRKRRSRKMTARILDTLVVPGLGAGRRKALGAVYADDTALLRADVPGFVAAGLPQTVAEATWQALHPATDAASRAEDLSTSGHDPEGTD